MTSQSGTLLSERLGSTSWRENMRAHLFQKKTWRFDGEKMSKVKYGLKVLKWCTPDIRLKNRLVSEERNGKMGEEQVEFLEKMLIIM